MDGELIGGRYQLERLIGKATSSRVYRARDSVLGRTVALKLLSEGEDEAAVERFREQARSAARLVHANLLTVIDRGQEQGRDYVVFEYLGGETLRERLRRQGPLAIREVLALGIQIASALAFADEQQGVRRQVLPESVLLGEAGQVKVADFGMSLDGRVDEDTLPHGEPDAADRLGDLREPGEAARREEIGSIGSLLYESLTGLPAAAAEDAALLEARRPDLPERLCEAVRRALREREPDTLGEGFASVLELKRELELCRSELERSERRSRVREATTGVMAAPASVPPAESQPLLEPATMAPREPLEPRRPRRRLATVVLPALVIAAAAAGGAAWYLLERGGNSTPGSTTPLAPVRLTAVAPYDPPPGDRLEGNSTISLATDGNPATAWVTERYTTQHFGNLKSGVGLIVQAARPVKLLVLVVRTDTPSFTAVVEAGSSRSGPFHPVSGRPRPVTSSTTFRLNVARPTRYYLLWITNLSPGTAPQYHVDVNEISAG